MREFSPCLLYTSGFEIHLRGRGCSWTTVSTYLRTFRAVYNRAVDCRGAVYVPHLFRSVYTGTRADRKRALDTDCLLYTSNCPKPEKDGSFTGNHLQSYRIEHRENRSIIVAVSYTHLMCIRDSIYIGRSVADSPIPPLPASHLHQHVHRMREQTYNRH